MAITVLSDMAGWIKKRRRVGLPNLTPQFGGSPRSTSSFYSTTSIPPPSPPPPPPPLPPLPPPPPPLPLPTPLLPPLPPFFSSPHPASHSFFSLISPHLLLPLQLPLPPPLPPPIPPLLLLPPSPSPPPTSSSTSCFSSSSTSTPSSCRILGQAHLLQACQLVLLFLFLYQSKECVMKYLKMEEGTRSAVRPSMFIWKLFVS